MNKKDNINLRFHQELITTKTIEIYNSKLNINKNFLWGCKCRSGKT